MGIRFKGIIKVLFIIASIAYPLFIFYFLVIRKTPLRLISLFVMAFALFAFLAVTSLRAAPGKKASHSFIWPSLLLLGTGAACLITDSSLLLKIYPLLMNFLFFVSFGLTLFQGPVMIYRFAVLQDKSIPGSPGEKRIASYCKKVTVVWMCFFVFNGSIAAWTIFSGSDLQWSVYNGGISYFLMGTLFICEYIVRRRVQKKISIEFPHKFSLKKVLNKTENSVAVEFSVPETSPYFDGHFPDFRILPAVAQVELAVRFASRFFGTGIRVKEIKRVKFTSFILPASNLVLHLELKGSRIVFNISSPDEKSAYSTGTLTLDGA